jgi:DNA-binding Xre family transcriptional regulator
MTTEYNRKKRKRRRKELRRQKAVSSQQLKVQDSTNLKTVAVAVAAAVCSPKFKIQG